MPDEIEEKKKKAAEKIKKYLAFYRSKIKPVLLLSTFVMHLLLCYAITIALDMIGVFSKVGPLGNILYIIVATAYVLRPLFENIEG